MGGGSHGAGDEVPDRVPWTEEARNGLVGIAYVVVAVLVSALMFLLASLGLGPVMLVGVAAAMALVVAAFRRLRTIFDLALGHGRFVTIGDWLVVDEVEHRSWPYKDRTVQQNWIELRELDGEVSFGWAAVGPSDAWTLRELLVVAMWTIHPRSRSRVFTAPGYTIATMRLRSSPPPGARRVF